MSRLLKRYMIQGLGIERLLDGLQKEDIRLFGVRRVKAHSAVFSVALGQAEKALETASRLGFSVTELPDSGLTRRLSMAKKQWLLFIAAFAAFLGLITLMQYVWEVRITNAGVYRGEVARYLEEQDIRPGVRKADIDTQALCDGLLYRLPQVAWVRAEIEGMRLNVTLVPGVPAPELISDADAPGDLVAAHDGIIQQISVFSGTAAVKPGDTVRAGDVLIQGKEKSDYGGAYHEVAARGQVKARVWLRAEAAVSATETVSIPTGRITAQCVLCCPWASYCREPGPDYLTADVEKRVVPLGGAWFPLWLEERTYHEVSLEKAERPLEEILQESVLAAMRKIISQCYSIEEIIDKAVNCCMIEGENILAVVQAEIVTDIGRFVPNH